ncbi:hypothetical protein GW17_00011641 [Ensete ventricosum]|nr:hypothetical protein GW17_00011641 [Ensete ventricosum]
MLDNPAPPIPSPINIVRPFFPFSFPIPHERSPRPRPSTSETIKRSRRRHQPCRCRNGTSLALPITRPFARLAVTVRSHRDATRLHEERTVDLIAARPVLLCVYIGVDTDGGGCRDIYSEDGSRVTADLLGIS